MILVVGATGMVGSEICQRLSRRGEKVRALVRTTSSTEKVALLRGRGAEVWVGDLKDPDSLAGACRGVNAVILPEMSVFGNFTQRRDSGSASFRKSRFPAILLRVDVRKTSTLFV